MDEGQHFESAVNSAPDYEPPQVEDVEVCAGTAEAASMALPVSQTD